jgi:hypothetical protein
MRSIILVLLLAGCAPTDVGPGEENGRMYGQDLEGCEAQPDNPWCETDE